MKGDEERVAALVSGVAWFSCYLDIGVGAPAGPALSRNSNNPASEPVRNLRGADFAPDRILVKVTSPWLGRRVLRAAQP